MDEVLAVVVKLLYCVVVVDVIDVVFGLFFLCVSCVIARRTIIIRKLVDINIMHILASLFFILDLFYCAMYYYNQKSS